MTVFVLAGREGLRHEVVRDICTPDREEAENRMMALHHACRCAWIENHDGKLDARFYKEVDVESHSN